jgi:hypothetical protein
VQLPGMMLAGALIISLAAWKEEKFSQTKPPTIDTVPKMKVKNIDEAIEELEKAQAGLEDVMKNKPIIPDLDMKKLNAEMEKAMKEIDMEKIKTQMAEAMKDFDAAKVKAQINEAMNKVNMEEVKTSLAEAIKDIDVQKLQMQTQEALAKVDMEKIKAQMEEFKKNDLTKMEADLKKIKPQLEQQMKKAKEQIEKAKQDMKEYKAFEESLEKDGLINKKEGYKIEHKDGQLIINEKVQPESVYNKYRSFLQKHKKLTIEKTDDDFNINND